MDIHIGAKVVPIKKTAGHRDFDSCAMHYRMLERDQPFLYVTAEASSDHSRKKERTIGGSDHASLTAKVALYHAIAKSVRGRSRTSKKE